MPTLLNMIQRMFLNRMINGGINKGVSMWANRGPKDATPDQLRSRKKQSNTMAKRIRQATNMMRRMR